MMKNSLAYTKIENLQSARRIDRENTAQFFIDKPDNIQELIFLSFKIDYKNHYKAAWVLEIVLESNIDYILPYLDYYTKHLNSVIDDSAIRPLAKINKWIAIQYVKKRNVSFIKQMKSNAIQELITVSFDWLIGDFAVASKAYTMATLYLLGQIHAKNNAWVHIELRNILLHNIQNESPAYKAQGKKILNLLKN